jgi:hypothetical protein
MSPSRDEDLDWLYGSDRTQTEPSERTCVMQHTQRGGAHDVHWVPPRAVLIK